jgi:hypothetical protein
VLGGLVCDACLLERLSRPFAAVSVALDIVQVIALQSGGKLLYNLIRAEGRLALADAIEHGTAVLVVRDGERHRVSRAAAGIDKGPVSAAANKRPLSHAARNTGLHDLG